MLDPYITCSVRNMRQKCVSLTWHVCILAGEVGLCEDGHQHVDALALVVQDQLLQHICNTQGHKHINMAGNRHVDNLIVGPSEMMFRLIKGKKLYNVITHNIIWAIQKTESLEYHW